MKRKSAGHKNWMSAVTFAEAGEWETAQEMTPEAPANPQISWFSRMFMAVTFAESGLADEALGCLDTRPITTRHHDDFIRNVGLGGIRMTYGVVAVEVNR